MKTTAYWTALACAVLALAGCSDITKGKSASEAAIARFHELYNEGRFGEIWDEAHPKLRAGSNEEKYTEFMEAVRRKLGSVTSTANNGWKVNKKNLTTMVMMAQKTVFENGEGTESFVFQMEGEKALLLGYNIQSMDLITK